MLKRIKTASILLFVLLFAAACASIPEEEIIPEFGNYDENGKTDLLGYEFIMASARAGSENPINPQSGNTARGDRLLQRYKDTEENFNVKITVLDECNPGELVVRSAAGIKYADLMAIKINDIVHGKYIQNGYFIPFSQMDIDLDSGLYGVKLYDNWLKKSGQRNTMYLSWNSSWSMSMMMSLGMLCFLGFILKADMRMSCLF